MNRNKQLLNFIQKYDISSSKLAAFLDVGIASLNNWRTNKVEISNRLLQRLETREGYLRTISENSDRKIETIFDAISFLKKRKLWSSWEKFEAFLCSDYKYDPIYTLIDKLIDYRFKDLKVNENIEVSAFGVDYIYSDMNSINYPFIHIPSDADEEKSTSRITRSKYLLDKYLEDYTKLYIILEGSQKFKLLSNDDQIEFLQLKLL